MIKYGPNVFLLNVGFAFNLIQTQIYLDVYFSDIFLAGRGLQVMQLM